MNIKKLRTVGVVCNFALCGIFVYMVIYPQKATAPTAEAVLFCAKSIIPALFVYMVLSRRIMAITAVKRLCAHPLWGGIVTVVMGIACGFPSGAKNCVYLYEQGVITRARGEYLCCVSTLPSVSFILGFAGITALGSIEDGIRLLGVVVSANLITAAFFYILFCRKEKHKTEKNIKIPPRSEGITEAVGECAYLIVKICGFIICFSVLGVLISEPFGRKSLLGVIIRGLFEFSGGIAASGVFDHDTQKALLALFLGFGSLSAIFQVASIIKGVFSLKRFFIYRVAVGLTACLLAMLT